MKEAEKEIEEIKQIFANNGFEDSNGGEEIDILAHDIINAGYHKTVWHKVADGDMPKKEGYYLTYVRVHYDEIVYYQYATAYFDGKYFDIIDNIFTVAWTEFYKYEEAETKESKEQ